MSLLLLKSRNKFYNFIIYKGNIIEIFRSIDFKGSLYIVHKCIFHERVNFWNGVREPSTVLNARATCLEEKFSGSLGYEVRFRMKYDSGRVPTIPHNFLNV